MNYRTEKERLLTFIDWPRTNPPRPLDLARAGFYYVGPGDRVRCAYCNGDLNNWTVTDDPLEEHQKLLPNCPFLKKGKESKSVAIPTPSNKPNETVNTIRSTVNNYQSIPESCLNHPTNCHSQLINNTQIHLAPSRQPPSSSESVKHHGQYYCNGKWRPVDTHINPTNPSPAEPTSSSTQQQLDYSKEKDRLKSFVGWTGRVDPRQLAHAGLFYLGTSDRVQCFSCQTIFRDWEAGDDPWIEHSKWYPDCPYIQLCLGKDVVREIRSNILKFSPRDVVDCVY